ncbi:hypothetical protein [Mycobacterium sp.]|uniref:hypothetical protein n=1 Tax=Mycobacterium sp. TaxID=1785 RepID=UPI002C2BB95F|nr:hypothetical protein [Mycobacterium sp.]HKP44735.1 hypothetical protein [Mycobacterium sp.]
MLQVLTGGLSSGIDPEVLRQVTAGIQPPQPDEDSSEDPPAAEDATPKGEDS